MLLFRLLTTAGLCAGVVGAAGGPAEASGDSGAVYLISNAADGNALVVFDRAADGSLTPTDPVPTGGLGTGAGLGTQGAVVVSDNGRWLVAVNPGSDDVSLFAIRRGRPVLVDTESSGGDTPVSVTVHRRVAYVLNGGDDTIVGLRIEDWGLEPIGGSTQHLSGVAVGGAQVEFTPDGRQLVVTEKNTNLIDVFPIDRQGRADPATTNPSNGVTPFGFAFDNRGRLIVSNANGGAPGASSLTSYRVTHDNSVVTLDGPEATNQTAACWVVVTANGRYAYTTNTGSASISGYRIGHNGSLTLLDADGVTATTEAGPTDFDLTDNSRFLYTLNSTTDSISIHRVNADGSLQPIGVMTGLPATTVGLAAT
jgi:6-phosphogluconolactonase (cycloisomerase 2 family)